MQNKLFSLLVVLICLISFATAALAQNAAVAESTPTASAKSSNVLPRFGLGAKISTLGAGFEAGTALTPRTNLRVGMNFFSYGRNFENDGINYRGDLALRSLEAHYDWFAFGGGFHLSPGVTFFLSDPVSAKATVPTGQTVTLNDVEYTSNPADPIKADGKITWNKVAPTFMVGWGNLLPRGARHFSVPFEVGVAVIGAPKVALNMRGGACDVTGTICVDATQDPAFQANVRGQQQKLKNDLSSLKVYPIVSIGFAYRF